LSKFGSDQVRELVKRNLRPDSVGGWEFSWDIVVAEGDADVFSDVARVHHISASHRNLNLNLLAVIRDLLDNETHLFSALSNFSHIKVKPESTVNVCKLNVKLIRLKRGSDHSLSSGFISDLNLFNSELGVALTVARELASQNSKTDLNLVKVCSGDFNENILCVEGDLGSLRVYNGRKREDLAFGVIEHRVLGLVLDDIKELLELLVLLECLE
jgi:hypothetical protein